MPLLIHVWKREVYESGILVKSVAFEDPTTPSLLVPNVTLASCPDQQVPSRISLMEWLKYSTYRRVPKEMGAKAGAIGCAVVRDLARTYLTR